MLYHNHYYPIFKTDTFPNTTLPRQRGRQLITGSSRKHHSSGPAAYSSETEVLNINTGTNEKEALKERLISTPLPPNPTSLILTLDAAVGTGEIVPGAKLSSRTPFSEGLAWGVGGAVVTALTVALASWLLQKFVKKPKKKKMTGRLVREIRESDDESNDTTVASGKWQERKVEHG